MGGAGVDPSRRANAVSSVSKSSTGTAPVSDAFRRSSNATGCDTAATLVALLVPAVIDQQPAHRLSAERKPVRAALPFGAALVLKPQPRFVDERRGLQCVIPPLTAQVAAGDVTQLAVNHGEQRIGRSGFLSAIVVY